MSEKPKSSQASIAPRAEASSFNWAQWFAEYGMLLVLGLLCVGMCLTTISETHPNGSSAGTEFADDIIQKHGADKQVLVVAGVTKEDKGFVEALAARLKESDVEIVAALNGFPGDARKILSDLQSQDKKVDLIACNSTSQTWSVWKVMRRESPQIGTMEVVSPESYYWPSFLSAGNVLGIIDNATIFAIIGIGMTMVIITGGIDLSVGSLLALAAVISTMMIRDLAGGADAGGLGVFVCCVTAIAVCGLLGALSGGIVLTFNTRPYVVPPFIMTLSMMLIARGLAYIISGNQTIAGPDLPASFNWLGAGTTFGPVRNPIVLMFVLYIVAHVMMSRTTVGRYIYAVGGNTEAARLSGVPVKRVLLWVYTGCGLLAGLGGVVLASRLSSGSATYGNTYELFIIAAVVVGGTSLSGGEGKVFGTLIGALIIAVVQSGLNQQGVSGRKQELVLGVIILAAVLLDMLGKRAVQKRRSKT
jgi:ribose transport system permease protein